MRRSLILALGLAILVIGGWYAFWGRILNSRVSKLHQEIQAEEQKSNAYRQALIQLEQLLSEYRAIRSELTAHPLPAAGTDEVIALYRTIESRCRQYSLRLNEITPSLEETIRYFRQRAASDSAISISISVKTTGPYPLLADFIEAIERNPYFGRLSRCGIYGSEALHPYCQLDLTFVAELGRQRRLADND